MRTRPSSPIRRPRLALLLVGLCWLALAPGEANADGCHVAERPVLGLTLELFDGPSTPAPVPASHAPSPGRGVRRPPCSPLTPGPTASPSLPAPAGVSPERPPVPTILASRFARVEAKIALPTAPACPPERPPRG